MIKLDNLSKSFGSHLVIDDLNESFKDNQITFICSASGAGKTTLLRIIAGLENHDAGSISGAEKVCVTFQEDRLFPWLTALQNIEIVSDEVKAQTLLGQIQLTGEADKYPNELSGGMCRRVALARSLAAQCDVIILDEPLKGLDSELKEEMYSLILQYAKSKIVIITTHDMVDVARLADRVLCFSLNGFKVEKDIVFDVPKNQRDEKVVLEYIELIKN